MKKIIGSAISMLVLFTGCATGGAPAEQGDTIKIGANFELSGPVSSYGKAELDGVNLAVKEINEKGGILGKKLSVISMDNKSDAAEVASVTTKLATQSKVSAIIGPATSGNTKAATVAATQNKIPLISPSGTADDVTLDTMGKVQPYVFRVCYQDAFQGLVMAKFANDTLKAQKAVIIADSSSDYAKGLATEFKKNYTGVIVAEESYTETDKDFSAIITGIKGKDFDVLFIPGYYNQAGLIIKQAREAGITKPIIGGDGFDSPELVNLAGKKALTDVYFSAHYSILNGEEKVKRFNEAFEKEYQKMPNAFSALAYDSVYLLADAIERGQDATPEKIKAALDQTTDFDGVTGVISIDASHNAIKAANVIKLKDGQEEAVTVIKP